MGTTTIDPDDYLDYLGHDEDTARRQADADYECEQRQIEEAKREQREADAALVESAGCVCDLLLELEQSGDEDAGWHFDEITIDGASLEISKHDPHCPKALAELIRDGGCS